MEKKLVEEMQNMSSKLMKSYETFSAINDGRTPHLLMDIHDESEVNKNKNYMSKNNIENA